MISRRFLFERAVPTAFKIERNSVALMRNVMERKRLAQFKSDCNWKRGGF